MKPTQIIVNGLKLPFTSRDKYSCPEEILREQITMISGRMVEEVRGKIWRPSYSYDYLGIAPISAPMFAIVARAGISISATAGPTYSYTFPRPPLMVTRRSISRITSFELQPGLNLPVRLTRTTLGIVRRIGTPVIAVATSMPPTPIHSIPMEPP